MSRLVLLLEERSLKELFDRFLPIAFPNLPFLCVAHEGKQDLEKSVPRKLRRWNEPGARFLVVRDQDSGDCHAARERLQRLCQEGGRPETIVRIACRELEAWYFGDPRALAAAFENESLIKLERRARYRDPDAIVRPAYELTKVVPEFQKVSGARRLAEHLDRDRNRSRSFQVTMAAIEHLSAELPRTGRT